MVKNFKRKILQTKLTKTHSNQKIKFEDLNCQNLNRREPFRMFKFK